MTSIKLKWGKEEFDVEIEGGSTVEVFKTQVWTLTTVPVDRQKYLGFPGGMLKDTDDLDAKVAKLKPGAKITLLGTAEGKELAQPAEKVVFDEDLTDEQRAKILKSKKIEILPPGIKNLGNTCYMNACLQTLSKIKELTDSVGNYVIPGADDRDIDAVLTNQYRQVTGQLRESIDEISPFQFVMALQTKFPRFAEKGPGGAPMQQDADECLRGILQVLSCTLKTDGGNRIDELFGFKQRCTLKCLECDEEAPSTTEDSQRVLICHLGSQTEPISHIYQGVQLSMKEHIEKNSPTLGRNAQYEKSAALSSLPPYLIVQFARFGYKGANDWAGTAASKVKLTKNVKFQSSFDVYDMCTDDLKKSVSSARLKAKEQEDAKMEAEKKKMMDEVKAAEAGASSSSAPSGDVEMKAADEDVEMAPASAVGVEYVDTGYFELVGIISHKGRTGDGGHYVGWTFNKKGNAKEKTDDQWICYDDETVSCHNFKNIMGVDIDLQGGRADTQISYINIYKKVTVAVDPGQTLGDGKAEAAPAEPAAASSS